MKYYVYISDAKVDMLLPQISDDTKKKISTEFGFDLKVLTAKRTSEFLVNENRIARLETVVAFIREWGNLGSVDEPDEYIEDSVPMRMSRILSERLEQLGTTHRPGDGLVYFAGRTTRTHFGLGGSLKHMVGMTSPPVDSWPSGCFSAATFIVEALGQTLEPTNIDPESTYVPLHLAAVHAMAEDASGLVENLEFVAKRLLYHRLEDTPGKKGAILLASPLYIAKAD